MKIERNISSDSPSARTLCGVLPITNFVWPLKKIFKALSTSLREFRDSCLRWLAPLAPEVTRLLSTEMWDINQSEGRLLDSAFPRKKRGNCRDDGSKPVALILMKISHCSWTLHDKFSQLWLCWWSIDGVRFQTESPVSAKAFSTAGGQAARSRNIKVWATITFFAYVIIFVWGPFITRPTPSRTW